ncbi:ferric reductase transmembrane protein [Trypanosoma theileri]|uniref:Ferric reductase transmembrane protein n=1 Tax=Trypanosoma theileri TaxID=67003 RepID=A0A1X0P2F3_9TRYP|nr:ferric reductase transmembrane protein [Trypanosoma theileri]ORC90873.1 ferric reductase transmembrane protein [Trypanosoma theileri]
MANSQDAIAISTLGDRRHASVNAHALGSTHDGGPRVFYMYTPNFCVMIRRGICLFAILLFSLIVIRDWGGFWSDIFLYHPISMAIAFMGILPELLQSIVELQGPLHMINQRRNILRDHRYNALSFKAFCAFGIIIIEFSKFRRSKSHFVTWHARIGMLCEILQILETFIGLSLYYGIFDRCFSVSHRIMLRIIHRQLAFFVVITGLIAIFLGMFSHYAERVFESIFIRVLFATLPTILALWGYFCAL